MSAFMARFLFVIWIGSFSVDVMYGGFTIGTGIVGILFVVAFIYWYKNSPSMKKCKTCSHDKSEHKGVVEMHGPNIYGVCVVGAKPYGEYIYGNCDCLPFVPLWKFWSKKR